MLKFLTLIKCKRKNKNQAGFMFVDALLSIVILGVGLASFISYYSNLTSHTINDEYVFRASYLASQKIEQILASKAAGGSNGYSNIAVGTVTDSVTQGQAQFSRQTHIYYVLSSDLKTLSGSDTGYKRIDVTVSWFNNTKSIQYMGLITSY